MTAAISNAMAESCMMYQNNSLNGIYRIMSGTQEVIRIDTIRIRRNWRTKDQIILQELDIEEGDIVSIDQIEKSISRLWNIGNFSKVSYQIDTLKDKRIVLIIIANDALTIMPDLSVKGNRKEYQVTAGINDNNFLGRNIALNLAGSFGTNNRSGNIRLRIPRQLLYRNMSLSGSFSYGSSQRIKYLNEEAVSGTAYLQKSAGITVGNPWHNDYKYTFSPDLSVGYFSHRTDSGLLTFDVCPGEDYIAKYLTFSLGESIGLLNRIRHQEEGYIINASAGYGLNLDGINPCYYSFGIGGRYAILLTRKIQYDAGLSTGYTTSNLPSVINYLGPDNVKGITTGERWGKGIWSANTSFRFTYINRDWFAVEQSFFFNAGNAAPAYSDIFRQAPLFSAGTSVKFMIPVIPWLGVTLYYAYRGDSQPWYSLEF